MTDTLQIKEIFNWVRKNGALLFAICIPLHMLCSSYMLGIWFFFTLVSIISEKHHQQTIDVKQYLMLLLCPILYLVLFLGLLYTDNLKEGWIKLSISFSFLIVPVLFFLNRKLIDLSMVFKGYLIGVLFSIMISFFYFLFYHSISLDGFYSGFSLFHPPSYFALMISIGIAIMLFINEIIKFTLSVRLILIVFLSATVFLISSKAGIIALIILFILKSVHVFLSSKSFFLKLSLVLALIISSIVLFQHQRIQNMLKNIDRVVQHKGPLYPTESTSIRWAIWDHSIKLIKDSPVLGYGTGDANEALLNSFNENAYLLRHVIKRKYNAHNTFFQIWLMIGVIGPLLLLLILYGLLQYNKFSYFSIALVILFISNFCLESMLERHAGVMIFTFVTSLLFVSRNSPFLQHKKAH